MYNVKEKYVGIILIVWQYDKNGLSDLGKAVLKLLLRYPNKKGDYHICREHRRRNENRAPRDYCYKRVFVDCGAARFAVQNSDFLVGIVEFAAHYHFTGEKVVNFVSVNFVNSDGKTRFFVNFYEYSVFSFRQSEQYKTNGKKHADKYNNSAQK